MATTRNDSLTNNHFYHIYSRSIAKYKIFNNDFEYSRMVELINLYRFRDFNYRFSKFKSLQPQMQLEIIDRIKEANNCLVEIVAFCLMPTHIHLFFKQTAKDGITKFMSKILNSYSKSFNAQHKRSGPLWTGRFKNVLVNSDEQLLHLTRYIHLNPTSAGLVDGPEDWRFSSYNEYINPPTEIKERICIINDLFGMNPKKYKEFVDNQKAYQRNLAIIKNILFDNYTG